MARLAGATSWLNADRGLGLDSNWFRASRAERNITPCIPSTKCRKAPITYDKALDQQRHKIDNMFAKLKDGRRIATR